MKILRPLLATVLLAAATARAAERPNVVVFLADDLGWMDIGPNNPDTFYETPNLDGLARRGVRFTDAYAACPVCSPTRASLLTGKYPQRTGITDYIGAAQPEKWTRPTRLLPAPYVERLGHGETTLAEAFKAGATRPSSRASGTSAPRRSGRSTRASITTSAAGIAADRMEETNTSRPTATPA